MTTPLQHAPLYWERANAAASSQIGHNLALNLPLKPLTVRDSIDARINYLQGELERLGHLRRKLESVLDMQVSDITGSL